MKFRRRQFLHLAASAAAVTVLARSHLAKAQGKTAPATALVPPASFILKNGKIITVDQAFTIAQAIAIARDRIIAVGSDEEMAAHTGPETRVIDLKGKTVVPGLI